MQDWCLNFLNQGEELFPGKKVNLELALMCVLSKGHLLIEDLPGMGKTTLVHYISQSLGMSFKRIQMTSDLLPQDITGGLIYNPGSKEFEFHPGALFADFVLCDELNRTNAKTQSALLEAMEEKTISIDGKTYQLPSFFTVMATMNPQGQLGTYSLPESQLDRFLFKMSIGYPDKEAELKILAGSSRRSLIAEIKPIVKPAQLNELIEKIEQIRLSSAVLQYIWTLLDFTRKKNQNLNPLSPRCGLDLVRSSKARAWMMGRDFVLPEDVKWIFPYVAGHRLSSAGILKEQQLSREVIEANPVI